MIMGSGRVSLLSGQIRCYRVEFTLNGSDRAARDRCAPARLAGSPMMACWADRAACMRRPAGPRLGIRPNTP
jgi:hypothetical protein